MTVDPYPRIIWSGSNVRIVQTHEDRLTTEALATDAMKQCYWRPIEQEDDLPTIIVQALVDMRETIDRLASK